MNIEKEIELLKERNKRVESDKTWETSKTRRVLIALFTYLAIAFYLYVIGIPDAWLNAIVPAIAFLLSTLTLPFFKTLWFRYFYKE